MSDIYSYENILENMDQLNKKFVSIDYDKNIAISFLVKQGWCESFAENIYNYSNHIFTGNIYKIDWHEQWLTHTSCEKWVSIPNTKWQ